MRKACGCQRQSSPLHCAFKMSGWDAGNQYQEAMPLRGQEPGNFDPESLVQRFMTFLRNFTENSQNFFVCAPPSPLL